MRRRSEGTDGGTAREMSRESRQAKAGTGSTGSALSQAGSPRATGSAPPSSPPTRYLLRSMEEPYPKDGIYCRFCSPKRRRCGCCPRTWFMIEVGGVEAKRHPVCLDHAVLIQERYGATGA